MVNCEYAKKEVNFDFFQLPEYKGAHGVVYVRGADKSCRGEVGCALYERFWFNCSIANEEQQKILKEPHRKEEWDEKCTEWLKNYAKRTFEK